MIHISKEEREKFETDGYIIKKKVIDSLTINKSITAIARIRKKCENYVT